MESLRKVTITVVSIADEFHILTVGWFQRLIEQLWDPVQQRSGYEFSHVVHPVYTREDWSRFKNRPDILFFRDHLRERMPEPDRDFLASFESVGIPSLHNMIMSDRILRNLPYDDVLMYATFLAKRLCQLLEEVKPNVVIVSFDSLHGSLTLAVARCMNIPVYAIHFSSIPPGLACFCDRMTPAARVNISRKTGEEQRPIAEVALRHFESGSIHARAYIAPGPNSLAGRIARLPVRVTLAARTLLNRRDRQYTRFTEGRNKHSLVSVIRHYYRTSKGRRAVASTNLLEAPPAYRFVLFGLHMQPESSIDVWAPFFSNQMWVVELISRSIPPTHKLLVKIHKSDTAKYVHKDLAKMRKLPGVELVAPFANTRSFLEKADLVIAIQGTMGLEAALIGKPVIMLGESPVTLLPSATRIGEIDQLPRLIRSKLAEQPPTRNEIIDGYSTYLTPFFPASINDWSVARSSEELEGYAEMFRALMNYLKGR